jgi:hypothetical protein
MSPLRVVKLVFQSRYSRASSVPAKLPQKGYANPRLSGFGAAPIRVDPDAKTMG